MSQDQINMSFGASREQLVKDRLPSHKKQFLAAFIACCAAICSGLVIGYSSPTKLDMEKPGRRLPFDDERSSTFGSLMNVGALIGGLVAGVLVDFLGRKFCLILLCIPYVLGWLLITYADSYLTLYTGRVITGVCCGIICLNTSVYITEIAAPEIRGILGSWFQLFVNLGIVIAYVIGSYVPWSYLSFFSACMGVVLMTGMTFVPESPVWLVRQGFIKSAEYSIQWLRGPNANIQLEIDQITKEKQEEVPMSIKELLKPSILKPFLIMEVQMFVQQFCGINAVIFNAADIFKQAGSDMNPNTQAIILASVMVVASVVASFLMDKAGRRILLMISSAVMGVSMFVLGGYYYLLQHDKATAANVTWLPILCLITFVTMFNFGLGPVPWLMMGEVFPSQARGLASSLVTASNWSMAFIITKTFLPLQLAIEPYGAFWFYGSISIIAVFYFWIFVPETKGKSIDEILQYFQSSTRNEYPSL